MTDHPPRCIYYRTRRRDPLAMLHRLRSVCEHPRAPWAIGTFALLLASPALWVGLTGDDYIHGLILTHSRALEAYRDYSFARLFEFASPRIDPALLREGILAWWADPQFKLSFFRPLSALTHVLDYALWPKSAWWMHAHNLLFFALVLGAVYRLYRELLPLWAAALGLAFYAFDPTRAIAITWIANRNALIACALSSYAIVLHLRKARGWSALCFAAAMFSGEGAIGATPYLFAAELFLARDAYSRRILRLLPYASIAIGCLVLARSLGYGVTGSGEYLDPLSNSAAYLAALPGRALALIAAEMAFFNAEWWNAYDLLLPGLRTLVIALASGALAFWAWVFAPLISRSASARFFGCGALLALLPAAATFPNGRTLGWVSIGVMGLSAEYVADYVGRDRDPKPISARIAAWALILLHGAFGAFAVPGGCWAIHDVNVMLARANGAVPSDPSIEARTVVFVNPPQDPTVSFEPTRRAFRGIPRPKAQRWLATGMSSLRVTRIGETSLEVEPSDGFLHEQPERVVRGKPFSLGDRIAIPGMEVEVTALTDDARPKRARFRFEHVLEDPSYLWLVWRGEGFLPFELPAIGSSVDLPRTDFATMVLGANHPVTRALSQLREAQ